MGFENKDCADYQFLSVILYLLEPTYSRATKTPKRIHPNDLLPYHCRRLLSAAGAFGSTGAFVVLKHHKSTKFPQKQIFEHIYIPEQVLNTNTNL